MQCTQTFRRLRLVLMSRSSQSHLVTGQWKRVRLRVLMRDGRTCAYCGQGDANEVDHVIPISKPGTNNWITNIQPLCEKCNGMGVKGTKSTDYRRMENS